MKTKTFNTYLKDINTMEGCEMLLGMNLTDNQKKTVNAKMEELKTTQTEQPETVETGEGETEGNNDLMNLVNDETEGNDPSITDEMLKEFETPMTPQQKMLQALQEKKKQYDSMGKHEKRLTGDNNIDVKENLQRDKIWGLWDIKRTTTNNSGYHWIGFNPTDIIVKDIATGKPILDEKEGKHYSEGDKYIRKEYREQYLRDFLEENATGELITIAGYNGLGLSFIKPYANQTFELTNHKGEETTITEENWGDTPIAIWSNIGRATKIAKCLAFNLLLKTDYQRTASQKFYKQDKMTIKKEGKTPYFLHFEKHGEKVYFINKNGDKKQLPENINTNEGYGDIINWARTV